MPNFGRLLDALSSRGLLSNTVVVVAGDHGESLGEHGERTHGMLLYESGVRVPLIVRAPGIKPAVRTDPASLADITPTILGLVGQASLGAEARRAEAARLPDMDGVDLLTAARRPSMELYAETNYPRVAGWAPQRSLVSQPLEAAPLFPAGVVRHRARPGETKEPRR